MKSRKYVALIPLVTILHQTGHRFAIIAVKLVTNFGAVDKESPTGGTEDHGSITQTGLPHEL
ncbi:MAG: hypothetical protein GY696_11840 [Gammaproteobacteria bacterium]|nr:hypothetical protein [Gammaproteobacteria bacterium]